MNCPCCSKSLFSKCCEPFLNQTSSPATAEQLMRSRYTAYTRSDIGYLRRTSDGIALKDFDPLEVRKWALENQWLNLKVISTQQGGDKDDFGIVEFVAAYVQNGKTLTHHEISEFRKNSSGEWRYTNAKGL